MWPHSTKVKSLSSIPTQLNWTTAFNSHCHPHITEQRAQRYWVKQFVPPQNLKISKKENTQRYRKRCRYLTEGKNFIFHTCKSYAAQNTIFQQFANTRGCTFPYRAPAACSSLKCSPAVRFPCISSAFHSLISPQFPPLSMCPSLHPGTETVARIIPPFLFLALSAGSTKNRSSTTHPTDLAERSQNVEQPHCT